MTIFLEYGLGSGVCIVKAKINSFIVHADLTRYGYLINEDKSLWEPSTVFDTNRSVISVTANRISKLKSSIKLIRKINCKIVKV